MTTYWQILGIDPTTDKKQIKRAYAKKLKQLDLEQDLEAFQALKSALDLCLKMSQGPSDETDQPRVKAQMNDPRNSMTFPVFQAAQWHDTGDFNQQLATITMEESGNLTFWQLLLQEAKEWSDSDLRLNRLRVQRFVKTRPYWLTKDIINYLDQQIGLFEFDIKTSEGMETLIELEYYKEVLVSLPNFTVIFPDNFAAESANNYAFYRYHLWVTLVTGSEAVGSAEDYYQALRSEFRGDLDVEVIYSAIYLLRHFTRLFGRKSPPLFDSYRFMTFARKPNGHPPAALFYYFNETLRLGTFPDGAKEFIEKADFGFLPKNLSTFLVGMMYYQIKDYQQAFDTWQVIDDPKLTHIYYQKSLVIRRKLNRQAKAKLVELSGQSRLNRFWNEIKYWLLPVLIMGYVALMMFVVTNDDKPASTYELGTKESQTTRDDVLAEEHLADEVHGYQFEPTSNAMWLKLFPKEGDPLYAFATEVILTDNIDRHYDFINQYVSESWRADMRSQIYYEKGDYSDLTVDSLQFFEKNHKIYVYSDHLIAMAELSEQGNGQFDNLNFDGAYAIIMEEKEFTEMLAD